VINQKRLIDRFLSYVQIDSETCNEKNFADFLIEHLVGLGFEIFRDNSGVLSNSNSNNIIAKLKGLKVGPSIALSAHLDTVKPGVGIEPVIENGIIRSLNDTILGGDDKAGIAAILEAVECVVESKVAIGDIELLLTIAEEGGLKGSKHMNYDLVNSRYVYVFDSGGVPGDIYTQGPAQDKITVEIIGKSSHAGICPEDGISAIQVVSRAIDQMKLLRIDEETTANIGTIKGGEATNIVCPTVHVEAESRSLNREKLEKQTLHMINCFQEACDFYGADHKIEVERVYNSYLINQDDVFLKNTYDFVKGAGLLPREASSGGGSDTSNYNENGLKALNLGIGMAKCHTLDEFITIEHLSQTSEIIYSIITNFCFSEL